MIWWDGNPNNAIHHARLIGNKIVLACGGSPMPLDTAGMLVAGDWYREARELLWQEMEANGMSVRSGPFATCSHCRDREPPWERSQRCRERGPDFSDLDPGTCRGSDTIRLLELINERVLAPWTIGELAAAIGRSPRYVHSLARECCQLEVEHRGLVRDHTVVGTWQE